MSDDYIGVDGKPHQWYNLEQTILSRNPVLSFDVGARGIGKTTAWSIWARKSWERTRHQWAIVVRREDEYQVIKKTFWLGIGAGKLEIMNDGIQCFARQKRPLDVDEDQWSSTHRWEPFGWWLLMKDANVYKQMSAAFSQVPVDKMLFDEFIIEDPAKRYLATEPAPLLSIMSSVFRNRPRRVCCFSNAGFVHNPYFEAYHVTSGDFAHGDYVRRGDVLFHYSRQPSPAVYADGLTPGETSYQTGNHFKDVTGEGVAEKPAVTRLLWNLTDGVRWWKVYDILVKGWLFVELSSKPGREAPVYNLDPYVITDGGMYDRDILTQLRRTLHHGRLRFSSDEARNTLYDHI